MFNRPMTLDEVLSQRLIIQDAARQNPDAYGLEVELEGMNLMGPPREVLQYWQIHRDGSLRVNHPDGECCEYVFRAALNLDHTLHATKLLFNYLNTPPAVINQSYRTSLHVHLNFGMETHRTIYNFMVLSLIFDELFVSQNGEHRIGNNFCLRSRDAQGQIADIVNSIYNNGNFFGIERDNRYSSVNFVSLMKYGTIEFRSMECTTDYERVKHWIDTLAKMKSVSRKFEDPTDIIRYFSRMNAREFLYFILGPQADKYAKVEGYERMLHDGMRLAQDLAYCSKWVNRKQDDKGTSPIDEYMKLIQEQQQRPPPAPPVDEEDHRVPIPRGRRAPQIVRQDVEAIQRMNNVGAMNHRWIVNNNGQIEVVQVDPEAIDMVEFPQ